VAECQICGRSFEERAYQVIVWGLGSFDSVECAEKAVRQRVRRARAAETLASAVSDSTTGAAPPGSPLGTTEEG
jgi:hypothetical protein